MSVPTEIVTMHEFMNVLDQHSADGHWTLIAPNGTMFVGSDPRVVAEVAAETAALDATLENGVIQ